MPTTIYGMVYTHWFTTTTTSLFTLTRVVSHCGLAIYIIIKYLKAKEVSFMETQIFHHAKIYHSSKNPPLKRNQNPSSYYNSIITNLKFQHKPKYHLSKILI
jgi:hypothetical protein